MKHEAKIVAVCCVGLLLTVSSSLRAWRSIHRQVADELSEAPGSHGFREQLRVVLDQEVAFGFSARFCLLLFGSALAAIGAPWVLRRIEDAKLAVARRKKTAGYQKSMRRAREAMQQRLAEQSEAVVRQRQEEEAKAAERRAAAAAAAQRAAAEQARAHAAARTTLADSHEVTAAQAAAAAAQPVRSQQQPNASPSPAPQPTSGAPGGSHPAGRPAVSASASQQPAGNSQAGGAQLTRAEALRQAREKQQALAAEVARLHAERVREMQAASRAMQAAAVAPPAGGSGVNAAAAAASAAAARAQDATGAAPQPAVPTPPSRPAAASPAAPAAPLGSGPFAAPPGSYEAERQRRVEADRLLRQQQDEEYEASLQRDRENSGTSRGSAAADSSRGDSMAVSGGAGALAVGPVGEPPSALTNEAGGDVDAAATAEAVQLLRRRREALQAEFALEAEPSVSEGHAQPPSDAPCAGGTSNGGVGGSCEVRVRLPDGSFATRRFTGGTAIGRVKAWVFSLERMPLWREEGFELATVVPRRQLAVGEALADVAAGCGRLLLFVEQTD